MTDIFTLPMEVPEQKNPPPRPNRNDRSIAEAAAKRLLLDVLKWNNLSETDSEQDEILADLIDCWADDGYAMARRLEDERGWDPDEDLVEILGSASSFGYGTRMEAVRDWVKANGIRPKLAVGDKVKSERHGLGVIVHIYADTAQYVIQTEEFRRRHPNCGERDGYLVDFESTTRASD